MAPPTTAPLLTLLPSYDATTLPGQLSTLAATLLTQSHQRAPHLKPDEEIARAHACAEIAIDRLREPLRLPPKKSARQSSNRANGGGGPPCKPAVYGKLKSYLEGVLAVGTTTPGTGKRKRKRDGEEWDGEGEGTPTKKMRKKVKSAGMPVDTSVPRKSVPLGVAAQGQAAAAAAARVDGEAPQFVMPAIRRMCKVYDTGVMAPHIYTGVCVVLRAAQMWPGADETHDAGAFQGSVTALVVALYLMVLTKMGRGQMSTKIFTGVGGKAVEMFKAKGLTGEGEISDWIRRINGEGWCKGQDWFESVPEDVFKFSLDAAQTAVEGDDDDGVEDSDGNEDLDVRKIDIDVNKDDPEGVLLPGLGTMLHDAVDWYSAARTREFERWKKGILAQLKSGGTDAIAVS
jgi:origin recognition complex subunit 6